MTYGVEITAPDGSVVQVRALLVCVVSTLLITEGLTKKLCLPWLRSSLKINEVAGFNVRLRGTIISFEVTGVS